MTPQRRRNTLVLIVLGFASATAVMLAFIALFFSSTQRLVHIANQLYIHPFAVSNAAADLKTALYEMRSKALVVVLMRERGQQWDASVQAIDAHERRVYDNLEVIKANFLGDMAQVARLEAKIRQWHETRGEILQNVRLGHFTMAEEAVRTGGTPLFEEIIALTEHVLGFAKQRARRFVDEGAQQSDALVRQGLLLATALAVAFVCLASVVFWRIQFLQRELSKLAETDFLTGLINRRTFIDAAEEELARARRYGLQFSLAVVDLDHFKRINDSHGHAVGDRVLKAFAAACRRSLRDVDLVGRIGGEEFGVLMPYTSGDAATQALDRLRQEIESTVVPLSPEPLRFTASIGATDCVAGCSVDQLMALADTALYQAKAGGRNRVVQAQAACPSPDAAPASAAPTAQGGAH